MTDLHAIRIEIPTGHVHTARVFLDGEEVRGIVGFDIQGRIGPDIRIDDEPLVILTLAPRMLEIDGGPMAVHVWRHQQVERRSRPSWLRIGLRSRLRSVWKALLP